MNRQKSMRHIRIPVLLLAAILLLTGCNSNSADAEGPQAAGSAQAQESDHADQDEARHE